MSTLAGVSSGVQAALMLARGRPEGLAVLAARDEPALATAARSFWAAALCLPAFVCLRLLDLAQAPLPPLAAHGFALQLLGYIIEWVGIAVVMHAVASAMGKAAAWPRFIAAWNWCGVVQYLLLVAASLPSLLGLPDVVGETARLVVFGWALWLEWYTARLALGVSGWQAAGVVLLAEALDVMLLAAIDNAGGMWS